MNATTDHATDHATGHGTGHATGDAASPEARAPWDRFAAGEMGLDHRAHLRLAFEALQRGDASTVLPPIERALRRVATAHGHPERYHATLTTLWLLVVAERLARTPTDDFDRFLRTHTDLLDARALPRRYYREATLAQPLARRIFVLPDRGLPPERSPSPA